MEISFFYTSQLTEAHWASYTKSFNHVFNKKFSIQKFKDKYSNNYKRESYHGFIIDGDAIVGGCSAIPWQYNYFGKDIIFALFVDAFVHEEYRKNEFALYDAYNLVKDKLREDSIPFIVSVPNAKAYPFWKKLAKWKDIGILPWYVLPIRLGNVIKKTKLLNISIYFILTYATINLIISYFFSVKKEGHISLTMNDSFRKDRFYDKTYIKIRNTPFLYRIDSEDGIRVAYLLNESNFSYSELSRAVFRVVIKEKIDVIIYIGKINPFQLALIKLPSFIQPRKFNFCGYEVIKDIVDQKIYSYNNWDFGLINFDVK